MTKLQALNLIKEIKTFEKTKQWQMYLRKLNNNSTFILYLTKPEIDSACVCYLILKEEAANTVSIMFDFDSPCLESPDENIPGSWNLGDKSVIENSDLDKLKEPNKTKMTVEEVADILQKYEQLFTTERSKVTDKQSILCKSYQLVTDFKLKGINLVKSGDQYTGLIEKPNKQIEFVANVKDGSFSAKHTLFAQEAIDLVNSQISA